MHIIAEGKKSGEKISVEVSGKGKNKTPQNDPACTAPDPCCAGACAGRSVSLRGQ